MIIFRIKEVRTEKQVSLKHLSEQTDISRAYLYDLENNRRTNPSIFILNTIAIALEVNVKDLFYTTANIEDLKQEMYRRIDIYGINSEKVLEISQLIDLLVVIKMREKLDD